MSKVFILNDSGAKEPQNVWVGSGRLGLRQEKYGGHPVAGNKQRNVVVMCFIKVKQKKETKVTESTIWCHEVAGFLWITRLLK